MRRSLCWDEGEKLGDPPEFEDSRGKSAFEGNRRQDYAQGRKLIVVPEENAMRLLGEPFAGESMTIRAFAKGFYQVCGTRPVKGSIGAEQQYESRVKRLDIESDRQAGNLFEEASAKKVWRGTPAARGSVESWAAGVENYCDAVGSGFPPNDADRLFTTREAIKAYDPGLDALLDETMAQEGNVGWRSDRQPGEPSSK